MRAVCSGSVDSQTLLRRRFYMSVQRSMIHVALDDHWLSAELPCTDDPVLWWVHKNFTYKTKALLLCLSSVVCLPFMPRT